MLETDFYLCLYVKKISIFLSATEIFCVLSWFSRPRGTLVCRIWAAQTVNDVTSLRSTALLPSVASVLKGVRSCGLKYLIFNLDFLFNFLF
jgi:hypothetical protein